MKRVSVIIAAVLSVALMVFVMAGCSGQPASSASASSSASSSASAASAQSQDEIIAELKAALANAPAYKSVTITEEMETTSTGDTGTSAESSSASTSSAASEESNTIKAATVYKFDMSGDKLKTSLEAELDDVKLQYFTDGDDAVIVTDGPVYSGTAEQFGLTHTGGVDAYLKGTIGDFDTLVNCVASAEKLESNGLTFYMLTLDPAKYIASDEILTLMADNGEAVKEALYTIGFEEDGSLATIDEAITYEGFKTWTGLTFSDYDSTVIDPMPKADKTYDEMEEDIAAKLAELSDELDATGDLSGEAVSSAAAEAK